MLVRTVIMNKEEFEKIVKETKVTGATINTGDPLQDLMSEVYWEGYIYHKDPVSPRSGGAEGS